MVHTETLFQFLKARLFRSVYATIGLIIHATGVYLQLQANMGVTPWNMLNQGLSINFDLTFGQASIMVSALVICLDLLMRESIGLGTILDAFVVGWTVDVLTMIDFCPIQTNPVIQFILLVVAMTIMAFGSYLYMKPGLSCGPRDAMLVAIGKRLPQFSIGTINIALLAVVMVVSYLLGGQFGLGTIITIFGTGFIMDLVFKVLKFEPRDVVHEGLNQTFAALKAALAAK